MDGSSGGVGFHLAAGASAVPWDGQVLPIAAARECFAAPARISEWNEYYSGAAFIWPRADVRGEAFSPGFTNDLFSVPYPDDGPRRFEAFRCAGLIAERAESPQAIEAYFVLGTAFERSELTAQER